MSPIFEKSILKKFTMAFAGLPKVPNDGRTGKIKSGRGEPGEPRELGLIDILDMLCTRDWLPGEDRGRVEVMALPAGALRLKAI